MIHIILCVLAIFTIICILYFFSGRSVYYHEPDLHSTAQSGPDVDWIPWLGKNGRYGYADRQGNIHISPRFVDAKPFAFGRAPAYIGGKQGWGLINPEGKWLVKPSFTELQNDQMAYGTIYIESVRVFEFPLTTTIFNGVDKAYLIDANNKVYPDSSAPKHKFYPPPAVIQRAEEINAQVFEMDCPSRFFFYTPKNEDDNPRNYLVGTMDLEGNIITEPLYSFTSDLQLWSASDIYPLLIRQNNHYGYMASDGTIIASPRFTAAEGFYYGYAKIKEGEAWGLLNADGKPAAPAIFSRILRILPSGLICAEYKGEIIFWDINTQRQWLPKGGPSLSLLDNLSPFIAGNYTQDNPANILVCVSFTTPDTQAVNVYTRAGSFLGTYKSALDAFSSCLWLKNEEDKWGAMDMKGNTIIPFKFDYVRSLDSYSDAVLVYLDEEFFYVDSTGREYREK